jgi:hypothetical protein
MPTSWPTTPRLRLVLKHLGKVRDLDSFLRSDECIRDVKVLQRLVDRELFHAVFEPAELGQAGLETVRYVLSPR